MKNYPLLTVNKQHLFYNWQNTIVKPLLNQIKALSYYSYFMIPPYRVINNNPFQPVTAYINDSSVKYYSSLDLTTPLQINNQSQFWTEQQRLARQGAQIVSNSALVVQPLTSFDATQYNKIPVHSYYQTNQNIPIQNINIPQGSYIVSNARAEGEQDTPTSDIRMNFFKYYIFKPGGVGSFWVLTDINSDLSSNKIFNLTYTYLRNAGEIFGYAPKFNFTLSDNRFVTNSDQIVESLGATVTSANLGTLISGNNFVSWHTLGRPIHFTHDANYEEVIMDDTYEIEFAYGNEHRYTINTKNTINPNLLYIDFI